MKKITVFSFLLFALIACNQSKNATVTESDNATANQQELIGGDKDDHGCMVGAGETWSEIKQACVQIFNIGIRLNPVDTENVEVIISAFALFNDDQSLVEVFLPDEDPIILKHVGNQIYQNNSLKYDANHVTLSNNNEVQYQGVKID